MSEDHAKRLVPLNVLVATSPAGHFWRSLEERAGDVALERWLHGEFPDEADPLQGLSRRDFLKLSAAALALAGLAGCNPQTPEAIVPAVRGETAFTPGVAEFFATALACGPEVLGVLVENHMGRPTKIEGNPLHPASLGATNLFAQAEILRLYDPDRSQALTRGDEISTWEHFLEEFRLRVDPLRQDGGAGMAVLTAPLVSPTLRAQFERLKEMLPAMRWYVHDPLDAAGEAEVARAAFGTSARARYDFAQADVVVALDGDFLFRMPGSVRYARDFADRRRGGGSGDGCPNRLYVAEACPSLTGAKADHRLPVRAAEICRIAAALARELGVSVPAGEAGDLPDAAKAWIRAAAGDLRNAGSSGLVLAGPAQPKEVHAACWAMNAALGSVGRTVRFIEDPLAAPGAEPFAALAEELAAGRVHALLMLDVNPIYDAPANWPFAEWLRQVPFSVHLGLYRDETGRLCNWHVPLAHPLEMWSDAISSDGTAVIVQPLIRPLYGGRNPHELLALLADELDPSPRAVLRSYWAKRVEGADDAWWDEALRTGVVQQPPPRELGPPPADALARLMGEFAAPPAEGVEVRFAPDHTIWDGRYANNAWLQEIPDPLTKLCWTNAALLSPRTAARLNIRSGNYVRIVLGEARLTAPAWILPGHADESVTLPLGYGRPHAGRVGSRVGYDALALRPSEAPWFAGGAKLEASGGRAELATTQQHHAMEGREHVRVAIAGAASAGEGHHPAASRPSLYPDFPQDGPQWGMVIDLARCIGCNACMVACQAENNIPVVGAEGVRRGREMHWIRLDRYFRGDEHNPDIHHQPVPCMHCEKAPCELVCPVAATSHSRDGLNEMTYNRCVGTRYCSNNCPYKVRRFNFLEYVDRESPTLAMQRNPDVTVRSRGVMEKCTYCVQRIRAAEIVARRTDRPVGPQDVVTACQQVCPTQAIVFGNIKAAGTPVAEARRHPDHYALLAELNTRPRTTYLADLKNPNRSMG